jgi:hypothetical protein
LVEAETSTDLRGACGPRLSEPFGRRLLSGNGRIEIAPGGNTKCASVDYSE